jgi:DNA polymerase elongation subunit (family B)
MSVDLEAVTATARAILKEMTEKLKEFGIDTTEYIDTDGRQSKND